MKNPYANNALVRMQQRRMFIKSAATGTAIVGLGGLMYRIADARSAEARNETRPDGLVRLPPGQRVIERLKPMGGRPGSQLMRDFSLEVHGEVEKPARFSFATLQEFPVVEQEADVHCVTGWSVLGSKWKGVRIADLADYVKPTVRARYVIFEAAHGYTANVPIREALKENCMVTWQWQGRPLPQQFGGPVRGLVPDLYFWKSAKYITGIRFQKRDEPGFWEVRGYHNRGNPWREERNG